MTMQEETLAQNDPRWRKLAAVAFDASDAAFPFARRLARDNGWSDQYAARVIEEYRRFAFLSVAAGHETTPSDEVDQAWHLHLTYTRHYWGAFADALGAPLHHNPTAGGPAERNRYADNYARTLNSYETYFGEKAPPDIWPAAKIRFGDAPYMQRVNRRRNFVIPKNRALPAVSATAAGVALTASVAAQDIESSAAGFVAFLKDNPLILLGVGVLIVVLLLAAAGSASGRKRKGDNAGGAVVGGDGGGGGKSGGKGAGKGDADGDGGSGCSGCGGGCGG